MPDTKVVRSPVQLGNLVKILVKDLNGFVQGVIAGIGPEELLITDHNIEDIGPVVSVMRQNILMVGIPAKDEDINN